jgi:hypothetical protein
MINVAEKSVLKKLDFKEVPELKAGDTYRVFDVWIGKDEGCFTGGIDLKISIHDTSVLILKDDCAGRPGIIGRGLVP